MGVRYGLVGTGFWAEVVHATTAVTHPGIDFIGIYGRNQGRAQEIANQFGVKHFSSLEELLDAVDIVAIALPPDAQVDIALRAVAAGKHVLLEKPIATNAIDARRMAAAIASAGVASINLFTYRFIDVNRIWFDTLQIMGNWDCGRADIVTATLVTDNPFGKSPWRHDRGALWDWGPHALSILIGILGKVSTVTALQGMRDQVHVALLHEAGRTSTMSLTMSEPASASASSVYFYGSQGRSTMPPLSETPRVSFRNALSNAIDALLEQINGQPGHPCDVHYGAQIVQVLQAIDVALQTHTVQHVRYL